MASGGKIDFREIIIIRGKEQLCVIAVDQNFGLSFFAVKREDMPDWWDMLGARSQHPQLALPRDISDHLQVPLGIGLEHPHASQAPAQSVGQQL